MAAARKPRSRLWCAPTAVARVAHASHRHSLVAPTDRSPISGYVGERVRAAAQAAARLDSKLVQGSKALLLLEFTLRAVPVDSAG